jgi:5-formyltetrahydrofolate cyclo-ligase
MAERRNAVPDGERSEMSALLCRVTERELLAPMRKRLGRPLAVCLYGAFRSEADPADLAASCLGKGDAIYAPRVVPGGEEMEVRRLASPADWTRGRYGVPEPDPDRTEPLGREDLAGALDLVLVPGLAFDRQGRRLGYGGGHYDRLYRLVRAIVPPEASDSDGGKPLWVGFAFSFQIAGEALPVEPHDLRLDAVATERGIIWCGRPPG